MPFMGVRFVAHVGQKLAFGPVGIGGIAGHGARQLQGLRQFLVQHLGPRARLDQALLGQFAVGDVGKTAHHAFGCPIGVALHHIAPVQHPYLFAVGAVHAVLMAVSTLACQAGIQCGHDIGLVVRVQQGRKLVHRVGPARSGQHLGPTGVVRTTPEFTSQSHTPSPVACNTWLS